MAYEARTLRRQKVKYNDANTDNPITYQRVTAGAKVTPSAVTITVYDTDGTSELLAAAAMTVSGTKATYSLDTTTVADFPVATGYRALLSATVGGVAYADNLYFDVVKNLLLLDIGRDQLLAIDDRIAGMEHAGDEDFSEVIEAVRDEIQVLLETKSIEDGRLLENMVLDKSRISVPARFLTLAQIFESKKDFESADRYRERFDGMWRAITASIQYDVGQDMSEDSDLGGIQEIRLIY